MFTKRAVLAAFSLCLRGMGLSAKFILIFYLAKSFTTKDFATFSIVYSSLVLFTFLVGFELYTFYSRELNGKDELNGVNAYASVRNYFFGIYVILFIVASVCFGFNSLIAGLFSCLLIIEHSTQEVYRCLIALDKQLKAAFLMFLKNVSPLVASIIIGSSNFNITLKSVMLCWLIVLCISFLIYYLLFLQQEFTFDSPAQPSRRILHNAFVVGSKFVLAGVLIRGLFTLDKYLLNMFESSEVLAVYSFFIMSSGALLSFLDATVIAFYTPRLLRASHKNACLYKSEVKDAFKMGVIVTFVFSTIYWLAMPILLGYLGKSSYLCYQFIFYSTLLIYIVVGLATIPSLVLYSTSNEKLLAKTSLFLGALFLVLVFCLLQLGIFNYRNFILVLGFSLVVNLILRWLFALKLMKEAQV